MADPFFHYTDLAVRWTDQDSFGHVNHAIYLSYFEQARVEFFHELNVELDRLKSQGEGPILARCECDYHIEIKYPDQLRVETTALSAGTSSFLLKHRLFRNGHESPAAEAVMVLVWYDYFTHQSQSLPPALRNAILRYKND